MKQPDLGTSLLVLAAGLYVIFFAGLSWKLIVPVLALGAVAIAAIVLSADAICADGVQWPVLQGLPAAPRLHAARPDQGPARQGLPHHPGQIAIGSGGLTGKGFMQGTQTHLEFIPERTTDFIFAAFAEEFGLAGVLDAAGRLHLPDLPRPVDRRRRRRRVFTRLLAGAITLSFFTYAFVNMGMVSGILPVVGVPLPFISYGGTAMVTLGLGLGILMSVAKSRRLMQS